MTQWIITSSLLIAAVLFIRALAGDRLSARLRYALWGLVLLRLLIPGSIGESALSLQNWLPDAPTETTWTAPTVQQTHPVQRPVIVESELPETSVQQPQSSEHNQTTEPSRPVQDAVANETIQPETLTEPVVQREPVNVLPIVWVVGMVIVGGVFLVTNVHFALRLRRSRGYAMTETVPVYAPPTLNFILPRSRAVR